jgi:CubicO group peptidase (beta-lactamase class C family)
LTPEEDADLVRHASSRVISGAIVAFVALLDGSVLSAASDTVAAPAAERQPIEALMTTLHGRGQFDGSILVARAGAVIYRAGFGYANESTREPFQPTTVSSLASVSKPFTAMAVMMLAEEGALGYDDPITRFLPELTRYAPGVTVRHLLNHTSGIPDVGDLGIDRPGLTNGQILEALVKESSLASPAGTHYRYSNAGWVLLAAIVERLSGRRMADFLAARIFKPLSMDSTYVRESPAAVQPAFAMAYDLFGQPSGDTNGTVGDGGVFSTVDDLYKWDRALAGSSLLRTSTHDAAFTPPILADGRSTYGFGWNVRIDHGAKILWHAGSTGGYRSYIERRPAKQVLIVMLTNHGNTKRAEIASALVHILQGQPFTLPGRSIARRLYDATKADGIDAALQLYQSLRTQAAPDYDFSESELNTLGYQLLSEGRVKDAVRIFERNTVSFPTSSNAFDSLGDAYVQAGERERAIASYARATAVDPGNRHAAATLATLRTRSTAVFAAKWGGVLLVVTALGALAVARRRRAPNPLEG